MLKKIGIGFLAVVIGILVFIAMQPDTFQVQRATTIAAMPDVVFPQINSLENWPAWSPWAKKDPAMQSSLEGPAEGVGSSYSWAGNDKVGEGRMTITQSVVNERVDIKLEFFKPWAGTNDTAFILSAVPEGTRVTWLLEGESNFPMKAMGLFMDMDSMMGPDFEAGLASLKQVSEDAEAERMRNAIASAATESTMAGDATGSTLANAATETTVPAR